MKLLIDMNLSPDWILVLQQEGWEATHWSQIGDPKASDKEILTWAKSNGYIVFTHDLDYGAILAATEGSSPSVIQIRVQNINPHHISDLMISVIKKFQTHLEQGAIVSVDASKSRARILPLQR
jgi:predicted nuclease of predicted toxin-antitoxin system